MATTPQDRKRTDDARATEAKRHDHVDEHDANRDPITNEPGAHPVGSGVGAAAGGAGAAAAGAAIGAAITGFPTGGLGAPIGGIAGAIVGGLVGGLAGKSVAESINPTEEHNYWREEHLNRDYVPDNYDEDYDRTYAPAYQYGWETYSAHNTGSDKSQVTRFEDVEDDLGRDWDKHREDDDLTWDKAKPATRDAWHRVHEQHHGSAA